MKYLAVISLFIFTVATTPFKYLESVKEEKSSKAVLSWEKNKSLNWTDFKGLPKKGSPFAAECFWEINYSYSFNPYKNKILFDVNCYFNSAKSWVKEADKSQGLLAHEQLHFDIAELCSRKLRKQLNETRFQKADFKTEVNAVFDNILEECDSLQKAYDEQTNHGLIKKQQAQWIQNVNNGLAELSNYEYSPNKTLETTLVRENFLSKLFKKIKL